MTPVIYACTFRSVVTGEQRSIVVELTAAEFAAAARHQFPDLCRQAMALRHAYRQVPDDFGHDAPPARRLLQ
jgi:hypothetical protein